MAGKESEYRMAIKIAGEIEKSLYNCTDLTRKELNRLARDAAKASAQTEGSLKKMSVKETFIQGLEETGPIFGGMEKAGVMAFRAIAAAASAAGAAVVGVGTMAARAGIEFESAFAGVKKTTEATAQEYEAIERGILSMTREIPASADGIAAVAEAAGQLGIGKEDLLDFSRVMIDLGESTNLSAEEAASALAKFSNITGMDAGDYGRLGSAVVALGNSFATTEADIVSMATRLASSGELAGFTEAQILAMSTAMSSVGIEAEAGGSAMGKMIKAIQVAVETGSGSLEEYARVSGKSASEFKEDFEKDGLSAVAAFISGLNDVERNGKSATVILDEMGLTEVRLSNTLLSLANANEMMYEAVETANQAWEENTALAKEAGQRYETTESRLAILGNGFEEMGIAMYGQFNGPLREGIDAVTQLVHEATADIGRSNVIRDFAQDVADNIPPAIRAIQETAEAAGNLAEPFLAVGGWLADNPKVMVSAIAGVGSALAAYKVAKGITSLAGAFASLGAASLPVLGVAGGIAALVGVGTYFAQLDAELTQANLEGHFGDIALSMEEINNTARQIVGDGYLDQLDEIMAAEATSDNLMRSMEEAVRDINAERWKLSVGLSFSAEDKEEYARTAQQYIADVQSYIANEGYTFQMSAELLLSDSVNMGEIVADNTAFYTELATQMQGISDEVSRVITEALEKGLEIDQAEIDRLLADAQRVHVAFADAEYMAELEELEARYSGVELDSETAMILMEEINSYMERTEDDIWASYNESVGNIIPKLTLDDSYTQEDYEAEKQELRNGVYQKEAEVAMRVYNFISNTIEDAYGGEMNPAMESIERHMGGELEKIMASDGVFNTYALPEDWAGQSGRIIAEVQGKASGLGSTQDAIGELAGFMAPVKEKIDRLGQQVESNGGTLDAQTRQDFDEARQRITAMEAIGGSEEAMWEMFGHMAGSNEDYALVLAAAQEQSAALPQAAIDAIYEKQPEVEQAARDLLGTARDAMGEGFDVSVPIGVTYKTASEFNKSGTVWGQKVDRNADGGIITRPTVSWLAEGGYPESVIPLDGSANALSLWRRTGELLGVTQKTPFQEAKESLLGGTAAGGGAFGPPGGAGGDGQVILSPSFHINVGPDAGEGTVQKIRDALYEDIEVMREMFEDMMERHGRNRERYSFSG